MTKGVGGSTAEKELQALALWANAAPAITIDERRARIDRVRRLTVEAGAEALLIGAGPSLLYFAGIPWRPSERLVAMLLPISGEPIMISPAFELGTLEADLAVTADIRLWQEDESPSALVADACRERGVNTLAIDPTLAYLFVNRICRSSPQLSVIDGSTAIDGCRMIKSPAELELMQQAKSMTLVVQQAAARILHEGITATDVRLFIDQAHRTLGAAGSSFCIVQFGRSTAFPHGIPGECRLEEGDVVLIDTGCIVGGYHSDITRTYVFGQPTVEQRAIWEIERAAQQSAFDSVEPGVHCEAVDHAARDVLEKAGLGPGYRLPGLPHRTGHGIGLSIHEPAYLVRGDKTPLRAGMCFSNEPMIVVPGRFGIRLEDHFHVIDGGAKWFTEPSPSIDTPFG